MVCHTCVQITASQFKNKETKKTCWEDSFSKAQEVSPFQADKAVGGMNTPVQKPLTSVCSDPSH